MRRRPTSQDRADQLLAEWAAGLEAALGGSYPSMPVSARVQGSRPELSTPERYAYRNARHERLDRAVRRVREADPIRGSILWQLYVDGYRDEATGRMDEQRMAEDHGVSMRTWRRWKEQARGMFLAEFEAEAEAA